MASMAEIREGFLCPICMKDLTSMADLQDHFELEHAEEDKAVLKQFKGFFDKAKRKILGKETRESVGVTSFGQAQDVDQVHFSSNTYDAGGMDVTMWEPQELGTTRGHIDAFKHVRDARIDRYVVETNKLLIRLDKLISSEASSDPGKRKVFEKSVVMWAPDKDVNLCTTCGRSFSITRRRHHCRLCGGIMCNRCSQFLSFSYAKKLTNPSFQYDGEGFHRSNSNSSLNSIMSAEGEPHIRTCYECRNLLERRDQQIEQRHAKPTIVLLYEKMRLYITEAEENVPKFMDMLESLTSGDNTYTLMQAQQLRVKLVRLYESIDNLSKRIINLDNDGVQVNTGSMKLQRAIRMQAASFLQENMLGMQSLPNEQELEKIQEAKRIEVQKRIEEERRAVAERERKRKEDLKREESRKEELQKINEKERIRQEKMSFNLNLTSTSGVKDSAVKDSGWKPLENSNQRHPEDDPMIQQINIIRSYIKQAKQAKKFDEVKMLEENLRELQQEYWRQQNPGSCAS